MPIVSIRGNEIMHLGTGFVVWPGGILVTAKHVIEGALPGSANVTPIYAIYATDEKHTDNSDLYVGGPIRIEKIAWSLELDIAYCLLQTLVSRSDNSPLFYPTYSLSGDSPIIGEHILGLGYCKNRVTRTQQEIENDPPSDLWADAVSTTGQVAEIYSKQRDSYFLKFPCFQTTARFEPGMSGGPVFRESGHVCGVICSAFDGVADNEGYISFCSILWPSFAYVVKGWFSDKSPEEDILVYDLIKDGVISCDDSFSSIRMISEGDKRPIITRDN